MGDIGNSYQRHVFDFNFNFIEGVNMSENAEQIFKEANILEINDCNARNARSKLILDAWEKMIIAIYHLERAAKDSPTIFDVPRCKQIQAFLILGTLNQQLYNIAVKESQQTPNCVVQDYPPAAQWYEMAGRHMRKAIYWFKQYRSNTYDHGSFELGNLYKEMYQNNSTSFLEENALEKAISYFEEVSEESLFYEFAYKELEMIKKLLAVK